MPTNTKIEKAISAQWKILLGAIVIALLVHGVLLVLFAYKAPPRVYSTARTAGVTFMCLNNQKPAKRQQFLNWLEYHEPSLISAPSAKYGYNQLNPRIKFRAARPDKVFHNSLPEAAADSPHGFEDLKLHEKMANAASNNFAFHNFQQIPNILDKPLPPPPRPETEYPLIKRDGETLPLSFSEPLFEDSEKLKPHEMSIRYDFQNSRLLPRVMILKSSGNRDFDLRVLRELSLHLDEIAGKGSESTLNIQWRKKEADE